MITAEIQKGHTYYRCTKKSAARCSQPYIREETLAADLSEMLTRYAMPEDWAQGLLKLADEDERDNSKTTANFVRDLREKVNDISRRIDRVTDLFVDQDIDHEAYLERKRGLMSDKRSLEEQIAKLQKGSGVWLEPMREWIKDAQMLDEIAKNNDLPSKKSSLQKIFGSNLTLRNKKVEETAVNQWSTLRVARENFSGNDLSFVLAAGPGFEPR